MFRWRKEHFKYSQTN